ncbi:MAG: ankyrin repeat domain-containing protein [Planctomycetota bacterium]
MLLRVFSASLLIALASVASAQPSADDLYDAFSEGDIDAVAKALNEGLDPNARDEWGDPLLYSAVGEGEESVAICKLLIERGADVNIKNKEYASTVVGNAAYVGNEPLVDLLIKHGADINATDRYGSTAVDDAAFGGQKAMVEKLERLGVKSKYPLHVAAGIGDVAAIERLTAGKHKVDEVFRGWRNTPLAFAVAGNQPEAARLLLGMGANPNVPDVNHEFPLSLAVWAESSEMCELLIEAGADVNARVGDEMSILDSALDAVEYDEGDASIVELLKSHGARRGDNLPRGKANFAWWGMAMMKQQTKTAE